MTDMTTATRPGTVDRSRMLSFDLETTGPDPRTAHVVTSALVSIDGAQVRSMEWLADPGVEIPAEATAVHGISTERARTEGRAHAEVVTETVAGIRKGWEQGRALVVFNAAFDLTILRRWEPSFEVAGPVIDPFVIDRATDPYRKGKRTLGALCEHHEVRIDAAHDAGDDALAAARLAWKLLGEQSELASLPWSELNARQAEWHAERQRDFAAYLTRQGRDASDVSAEWPMATV